MMLYTITMRTSFEDPISNEEGIIEFRHASPHSKRCHKSLKAPIPNAIKARNTDAECL